MLRQSSNSSTRRPTPSSISSTARLARKAVVHEVATKVYEVTISSDKSRCNYGAAKRVIEEAQLIYTWLTRDHVNYQLRVIKKSVAKLNVDSSEGITDATANQLPWYQYCWPCQNCVKKNLVPGTKRA